MGVLMAGHVLSAGHDLVVWDRTPGRASELVARGARRWLALPMPAPWSSTAPKLVEHYAAVTAPVADG